MSPPILRLVPDGSHAEIVPGRAGAGGQRLGEILVRLGAIEPHVLLRALALQPHDGARIGEVLLRKNWITPAALEAAVAIQNGAVRADLATSPPDLRLVDRLGAALCLKLGVLPWRAAGAVTILVVSRLTDFAENRARIEDALGPVRVAFAPRADIEAALIRHRRGILARHAENRVPAGESCRGLSRQVATTALGLAAAVVVLAALAPLAILSLLTAWAVLCVILTTGLRTAAAVSQLWHIHRARNRFSSTRPRAPAILPRVSLLVPLFHEREIAGRLVQRLARLDYPVDLLDICLVVEEDDALTRAALSASSLPPHMRQIEVPAGTVRTKPRALNYALDFCRGDIIGIYDAEDAPEPAQVRRVAARFAEAGPEVACLQGVLDFYNARENWLSRCFTIDYATWFRIVLPGLERLGFAIPLGGTTLFFRRCVLEELGGWDAHNVTEDAELGLRLARHGYRTELFGSVTHEEANCRAWPWVRQRSRWLKGYAMTWVSHMRAPRLLWRDLGPRRFFGVQVMFLGTVSTFLLAPLLWSLWVIPFGIEHPLAAVVPGSVLIALGALFLLAELLNIAAGALAVSTPAHRWLIPWVPTMHFYFPLGALASWKAAAELVTRPFYWDKTDHGRSPDAVRRSLRPSRRRA